MSSNAANQAAAILQLLQAVHAQRNPPTDDPRRMDTAETVHISALSLIKMLRHARAGVPMEVMGLMLGRFVDQYTVTVVDVFEMPQSGTSVTVESVDPVYQQKMLEQLTRTNRDEMVVGWYHSHPGFGCWLSKVDVQTQQSFEALHERAVAVVVDPVQSVRGKVMLSAFRSIASNSGMPWGDSRETTSNLGHLDRPHAQQMMAGVGLLYYALNTEYTVRPDEQAVLKNLHKRTWMEPLVPGKASAATEDNKQDMKTSCKLVKNYVTTVDLTAAEREKKFVGLEDPRRHLGETQDVLLERNIVQQGCNANALTCFARHSK